LAVIVLPPENANTTPSRVRIAKWHSSIFNAFDSYKLRERKRQLAKQLLEGISSIKPMSPPVNGISRPESPNRYHAVTMSVSYAVKVPK
jgi:hypothetical protein